MSKGILMFAHNSPDIDYYHIATLSAQRINDKLGLPVSIVTDPYTINNTIAKHYKFDNTYTVEVTDEDKNYRIDHLWYNKNRYRAYYYTPYTDTIILDSDYIVNSDRLLKLLDDEHDLKVHNTTSYLMTNETHEPIGASGFNTLWATVLKFRKSNRNAQLFHYMRMIQENWVYYAQLYKFPLIGFRNDYALTFALKMVNGHISNPQDYIHYPLYQVGFEVKVYPNKDNDNSYTLIKTDSYTKRSTFTVVSDIDLHMLDKKNFIDIMSNKHDQ